MQAVDGVSFELAAGEVLAVVGESGSGKSVTAMTLMGLTRSPNAALRGHGALQGHRADRAPPRTSCGEVRGAEIAMIFQDPMTSLNPVLQDRRPDRRADPGARGPARRSRRASARSSCSSGSGIPRARERVDSYPFEFSGGMRQRVMIALALSCNPSILIADEPTTALDVTIQAQILERIRELREETGAAVILVTHDLGVVADIADRIAVMYAGRIVEQGTLDEIFYDPQHPYTWGLLGSITRVDRPRPERLPAIAGLPPSLADRPEGCHFRPALPARVRPVRGGAAARGAPSTAGRSTSDRCWLSRRGEARAARGAAGRDRAGAKEEARHERRAGASSETRRRRPPLVEVEHLKIFFPIKQGLPDRPRGGPRARRQRRDARRSPRARRSGWWASRAAARPRCRARSCA